MTLRERIYRLLTENGPTSVYEMSEVLGHPVKHLRSSLHKMAEVQMVRRVADHSHKWVAGPVRPQNNGAEIIQAINRAHFRARELRSHDARARDIDRDRLAADVDAYLARGGQIEEVPGYRDAPPVTRVRAYEGGWS